MRKLKLLLFWLPALAWAGLVFWASSGPVEGDIPSWVTRHDKLVHGIIYGLFATLAFFALRVGHRFGRGAANAIAWLLVIVYGASDEIHQTFVPTRSGDPKDWLADLGGATLALFLLWLLGYSYRRITPRTIPPMTSD